MRNRLAGLTDHLDRGLTELLRILRWTSHRDSLLWLQPESGVHATGSTPAALAALTIAYPDRIHPHLH